jgi:hypothetical protein
MSQGIENPDLATDAMPNPPLGSICYTAQEWNDIQHGQLSPDIKKWS